MTLVIDVEDQARFDNAATVEEVNALHKELYTKYCFIGTPLDDQLEYHNLSRTAFERFAAYFNPHLAEEGADDPSVVTGWKIRQWCAAEGIEVNAKGHISVAVENQYRAAHDLPERIVEVVEKTVKEPKVKVEVPPSDSSLIRAWAAEQGIELPPRGRIAIEVQNQYREANDMTLLPVPVKVDSGPSEVTLMRAWGKANGFEVGLKGRLRPELIEAYREANNG